MLSMTSNRTHRRRTTLLAGPAAAAVALVALAGAASAVPTGSGVEPTYVTGNPGCADIAPEGADWTEAKLDFDPPAGDYTRGDLKITIVKSATGLDWTTDADVAAVIMKGGPNAHVYAYPGIDDTSDTGLRPPANPNNQADYGISHVTFCVGEGEADVTPGEPEKPADPVTPETPQTPVVPAPAAPDVQAAALEAAPEPAAQVLGVTLEAAPAAAELPRTGVETSLLALIGVVLLAAGGTLVALSGRPSAEAS
jgi:LPXTG-motif cell wall-anchored protein